MQEIVNVRIDDRLIHGQVAAVWSQYTKATRIMVVDDQVVHDVVNKEALKMACPQQCKLSILTAEKAAANLCAGKYDGEKVFIVAKNPKTIRSILDHGFVMDSVNVGNMGGKQNTRMLKKAVSVSEEDIENFLYLAGHGVKVTARMVPTEEAADFIKLIEAPDNCSSALHHTCIRKPCSNHFSLLFAIITEAGGHMIVDQPDRLHVGINNGRAYKFKSQVL